MKKIFISLAASLLLSGILGASVSAVEPRSVDTPMLINSGEDSQGTAVPTSNEEVENGRTEVITVPPTFVGESSESEESVRLWVGKNLLVAGNNISTDIKAPSGLMFMAGNNLNLKGGAEYGFLFGNNIDFAGTTSKDLYIAGNIVHLQDSANIGRDVFSASSMLSVATDLPGDLSATAGTVELKDVTIAGNLNLTADTIRFSGNVKVGGKFIYNDNASVIGLDKLVADSTETFHVEEVNQAALFLARVYSKIMSIAALFLAMAIIYFFCSKLHHKVATINSADRVGNVLVRGLAVLLAFPIAAMLAFMTFIAAPLGIIAILLYIVLIYLAQGFAGLWVGHMIVEKLFKSQTHVLIEILVGIVVLAALSLIPYLGALTGFLGLVLGLGLMFDFIHPQKNLTEAVIEEAVVEEPTTTDKANKKTTKKED